MNFAPRWVEKSNSQRICKYFSKKEVLKEENLCLSLLYFISIFISFWQSVFLHFDDFSEHF